MTAKRYPCPCCNFLTLSEEGPGTFDICAVCRWEDDNVQFDDPNYPGGANRVSLNEARANFRALGASEPRYVAEVRKPREEEIPR